MWRESRRNLPLNRIRVVTGMVIAIFVLVLVRLFFLQVMDGAEFKALALSQYAYGYPEPRRGDIYFSQHDGGRVTAAATQNGFLLFLNPARILDPAAAHTALSDNISVPEAVFFAAAKKTADPYEIIAHRLAPDTARAIRAAKITGVGVAPESWRVYPGDTLASHVLGFVSPITDVPEGRYGIERWYEDILRGTRGDVSLEPKSFLTAVVEQFTSRDHAGEDIVLTLDYNVQSIVEAELAALSETWSARSGGIMVMDPRDGKILAMAAFPNFDPNRYQTENDLQVFLNPFIEKIFEMGSVMKPITMAIALDTDSITPQTTYVDTGSIRVGSATISNFDGKARGVRTMTQVLEESLNTGAVFAMRAAGKKNFLDYVRAFGFEEKTNIDLPGEVLSSLGDLDSGRDVEFATASFGQGTALSPLAMARALGVLASSGKLVQPYIVEYPKGDGAGKTVRQVIRPQTAETVSQMLVDVVDHTLAGGKAKIEGYSIAAKTGTAQIPDSVRGGYSGEFLHSFFGYFPAYDPQFLIFLFLERPQGVLYASHTLTNPFNTITRFLIHHFKVPPDR